MATCRRTPNITRRRKSSPTMKAASAELEGQAGARPTLSTSASSPADTIKFGATVTLIDEDTDKKAVWQIVGGTGSRRQEGPHLHHLAAGRAR